MLISKEATTNWHGANMKHYTSKGYVFTKTRDPFKVKIEDLMPSSHAKIQYKCDSCNKTITTDWKTYKSHSSSGDYCVSCSGGKSSNWSKAVEDEIKKASDDGISFTDLIKKSNRTVQNVHRTVTMLIDRGIISKHPQKQHYFYNDGEEKVQKTFSTKEERNMEIDPKKFGVLSFSEEQPTSEEVIKRANDRELSGLELLLMGVLKMLSER